MTKPAVYIYEASADPINIGELCAGLEEEGIPYEVYEMHNNDIKTLAYSAANHSRLRVGIGITATSAALQIKNHPISKPVFLINLENNELRKLGQNAARAVKGGAFI